MNTEFIIQLGAVFTIISGIILAILKWNSERFRTKVNDDTVKRREVSDLLQNMYDKTQEELKQVRKDHKEEMEELKRDHKDEMLRRDVEIRKRDVIIAELISRLPRESREAVQIKVDELKLDGEYHTK